MKRQANNSDIMKKNICIILFVSILSSCFAQIPVGCKSIQCEVVIERIDSTNDYMIICASNKERKFKIVTRKVENDCRNVFVGNSFNLSLCSLNSMDPYNIMPCDWNYGWLGDDNVILNEAEYDCDIFLTDEIYGLCFTDDMQRKEEYQRFIQEHPLDAKVRGERANILDTIKGQTFRLVKLSKKDNYYLMMFSNKTYKAGVNYYYVVSPYNKILSGETLRLNRKYKLNLINLLDPNVLWRHGYTYKFIINGVEIKIVEDGKMCGAIYYSPNIVGKKLQYNNQEY